MAFWVDLRAILQIVETSGNSDKANPPKQKKCKTILDNDNVYAFRQNMEKSKCSIFFLKQTKMFGVSRK